jgi:hypothetical protein
MSAWERWLFRLLLSVLIGWEAILAGYKLGKFPYHSIMRWTSQRRIPPRSLRPPLRPPRIRR